jgi:translation initiation factor 1
MPDEKKPFHTPFASLAHLRGVPQPEPPAAPEPPRASPAPAPKGPPRAVVRMERAGRGGKKEVTLVEHLDLSPAAKVEWLKALKGALGCGGNLQGDALLLQGDHRERVRTLLAARGVRKITVA